MSIANFCIITVCLSIIMLIVAVLLWIFLTRRERSRWKRFGSQMRRLPIAPFHMFVFGFFIAGVILFYPAYYTLEESLLPGPIQVFQTLVLSVISTLRLFTLNGNLSFVWKFASAPEMVPSIGTFYIIITAFFAILAPVMTAGFILSFFRNITAMLRYHSVRKADIYLMSQLNERSLTLAKDILADKKGKKLVVFANVFEKDNKGNFDLVTEAKYLGAICLKRDVTDISLKKTYGIYRRIYLIGDNEDVNVSQALRLINSCRGDIKRGPIRRFWEQEWLLHKQEKRELIRCNWLWRMQEFGEQHNGEAVVRRLSLGRWRRDLSVYNSQKTQFYVFATTPESEVLLNSVDNSMMKVRRINENRNLVIDTLFRYPVYRDVCNVNSLSDYSVAKKLNIVIVGLGGYGLEFLKALCWSTQMPGFVPTFHVFDEKDGEAKFAAVAPELVAMNHCRVAGEAQYDIFFHNFVDVRDPAFLREFEAITGITTVFVTLGNDEINIGTAMKIRMQLGRNRIHTGDKIPPIYAIVFSNSKSTTVQLSGGLMSIRGTNYGITFIGSMNSRYSIESIEQTELEARGLSLHLQWASTAEDRVAQEAAYNRYEYFRRASMSEAFYERLRTQLGIREYPRIGATDAQKAHNLVLQIYEHRRWNAYTRSEGYVFTERREDRDDISKTHNLLIPYEELSDEEKLKDLISRGINAK